MGLHAHTVLAGQPPGQGAQPVGAAGRDGQVPAVRGQLANASPIPDEAPVTNPSIAYLQGIRPAVRRRLTAAVTAG
jgi:hypothetical protein